MRARFVNEELLGTYPPSFGGGTLEIYKNPPSIKRMGPWARALSDEDGNFYIASVEGEELDTLATTHLDMIDWLNKQGERLSIKWNRSEVTYYGGIAWQRYMNTNKFYLSESYEDIDDYRLDKMEEVIDGPNFFFPQDATFDLVMIQDAVRNV